MPADDHAIDLLRAHLLRWRGHWEKKLSPELMSALVECEGATLRLKAANLLHGPATCPNGRERPIKRLADGWQFCATSAACPCFMAHFHETSAATNMERRGVPNAAQHDGVKAKTRATNLARYGVETTGASPERQAKMRATNLARYGAENVFASADIQTRIKTTVRDRYGVDHISLAPEHQAAMRQGMIQATGVDNASRSPETRAKITATNVSRYGGASPAASDAVRRKMMAATLARLDGHPSQRHLDPAMRFRGEDDFRARCAGRRANDIAAETGYHPSMIHRYAAMWGVELDYSVQGGYRVRETEFAGALTELGIPFRQNQRILLPDDSGDRRRSLEIDFLFDEQRLGVELHGAYWHSTARGKDKLYHARKREMAAAQGLDLIQVFEDEYIDHPNAVTAAIRHRLGLTTRRVFARRCTVAVTSHADAAGFYDEHHVFGAVRASMHLALLDQGGICACMSFTQRTPLAWELVRYATAYSVVGGASRLLAAFESRHEWQSMTSFADLRWSNGGLYRLLGFTQDHVYGPDYTYVLGDRRFHKFNFRKNCRRFAAYADKGLSEQEMADMAGIARVYDAGKLRFVKKR